MKTDAYISNLTPVTSLTFRLAHSGTLQAILVCLLFVQARSASAALSFTRGTPTSVGIEQFTSSADSPILTGALTAPGFSTPVSTFQKTESNTTSSAAIKAA
jgi:hypothetical protein